MDQGSLNFLNMDKLDKEIKREIARYAKQCISEAAESVAEFYEERWITEKELKAQFCCFSPSWLRNYGHLLPRTRAIVTDEDGVQHMTGWIYPRNQIQHLIQGNGIKNLQMIRK